MASTMAVQRRPKPARTAGASVSTPAAARDQRYRTVQLVLFAAGAILMPLGLVIVAIGWYGVGDTPGIFRSIEPAFEHRFKICQVKSPAFTATNIQISSRVIIDREPSAYR